MAKTKTTPRSESSGRAVSAAAKRPEKTNKFLDDIEQALGTFDEGVFSIISQERETAYLNFITLYRDAFAAVWHKATEANVDTILTSVDDKLFQEFKHMTCLLKPDEPRPIVIKEKHTTPELDNILGAMTSRLPQQDLPSKEVCGLISTVFSDLSTVHKFQAKAARGITDLATLVSPEQMMLILAAAIPLALQLVLPPGTTSSLSTPPPPPATPTTEAGCKDIVNYCKAHILPDPVATCFHNCDKKLPTRVLVAAVYFALEKKYFDVRTPRSEIATMFQVTTA